MNETERIEKMIKVWEDLRDKWAVFHTPISKERIIFCSEKIAYYKGYLETLKLLDNLPQT